MSHCTCRPDTQILRIAIPPGASPEQQVLLVQVAVREYRMRELWGDFPRARTADEQRAASREVARPYMEAAR